MEFAKKFYGQLECLAENTEKYTAFSVPISKELDHGKTVTYRLKFIDSFRFMSTLLSSLVDNLSEKEIIVKIVNLNLIICHMRIIN